MTTERRQRPTDGRSATEWRLAALTALSTSYLVAWAWLFVPSAQDANADAPSAAEGTRVAATRRAAVFYDDLAPADRPPLVLPAGLRLASRETTPVIAMRTARAPTRRPMRVRTRSS